MTFPCLARCRARVNGGGGPMSTPHTRRDTKKKLYQLSEQLRFHSTTTEE